MQTPSTKEKEAQGIRVQEHINTINNLFHNKSNCYLKILSLWWVQLHRHRKLSLYILYLSIDIKYYLWESLTELRFNRHPLSDLSPYRPALLSRPPWLRGRACGDHLCISAFYLPLLFKHLSSTLMADDQGVKGKLQWVPISSICCSEA